MVATEKQYRVIGTRPIRPDGVDKVTGRAAYGADIHLPGMLHGRVLRSPHPHARIKRIDTSKAEALPGVKVTVTNADLPTPAPGAMGPGPIGSIADFNRNVLASDTALYVGHVVAAVCATDPHIAEDAIALIEVDYELLPHVMNVRDAMLDSAPILHPEMRTKELGGATGDTPTNIAQHIQFTKGDVQAGFSDADVVIEREFETTMVHQGYIEPQTGTAFWNRDGEITVWTSTQGTFVQRDALGALLQIPVARIKFVPMEIGGGFGGKIPPYLEPLAVILSKKSGKPVKMYMNREEVFKGTGPTGGCYLRIKIGAKQDGSLTAVEAYMAFEAGAFPGSPAGAGAMCAFGPYDIANQRIDAYDVVDNKPKVSPYRAPGAPASEYGVEAVINELAERLEMDPLELRLKNASVEGTQRADGFTFGPIGNVACLTAARDTPHYKSELSGANRGRGVASGFWFNIGFESSAFAQIKNDGSVALTLGSVDIGGTRASLAMQFAETLGINVEDVKPQVVDTDSVGYTMVTGGSRTTFAGGWAVYEAALDIRRQLVDRAAAIWDCDAGDVEYGDDGVIRGPNDEDGNARSLSFREIAGKLSETGGGIVGRADVNKTSAGPAFATHIVDVEVDPDTGKVDILRYTALQDVGTAIHPAYVEGQMQGGAVQGIGMALNEEYVYDDDGQMLNASLLDYRIPTTLDVPMIDTVIVEVPNPGHPYGVRGVGEVPIIPPAPALQAAINDAIGLRLHQLPMSPRVIVEQLASDDS